MQAWLAAFERYDVEAGLCGRRGDLQPVGGERAQRAAFPCVDGGQCRTEAPRGARFDFDEYDHVTLARDHVDLTAGQSHIARNHGVPGVLEESNRSVFTFTSEPGSPVHGDRPGKS